MNADNYFEVTYNGSYVEVISNGHKTLEFARRLYSRIVEVCRENDCRLVLVIGNSSIPLSTSDGFDLAEVFHDIGLTSRYRIAWVETNEAARDAGRFVDDVLYNRGLSGRLFDSFEEARNWLVGKDD